MKKTLKVLSIILLAMTVLLAFSQPVTLAKGEPDKIIEGISTGVEEMSTEVNSAAATIINWIWGISIIVAVIVVMIIGIKYIIGSTQEKAEYKKSLIPLVVGIVLIVFATTIVKFLFSM